MSDKDKNLSEALSQIEKQFGKGTVMKMGDREIVDIPSVSTGSLGLDIALGIGGLPKGRVVEIFPPKISRALLLMSIRLGSNSFCIAWPMLLLSPSAPLQA